MNKVRVFVGLASAILILISTPVLQESLPLNEAIIMSRS